MNHVLVNHPTLNVLPQHPHTFSQSRGSATLGRFNHCRESNSEKERKICIHFNNQSFRNAEVPHACTVCQSTLTVNLHNSHAACFRVFTLVVRFPWFIWSGPKEKIINLALVRFLHRIHTFTFQKMFTLYTGNLQLFPLSAICTLFNGLKICFVGINQCIQVDLVMLNNIF